VNLGHRLDAGAGVGESAFHILVVGAARLEMFGPADIAFMQGFANLLGSAIERQRSEAQLKVARSRYRAGWQSPA
jgi:GAF domain-containing protein